jgi:hypothetical protein
MLYYEIMRLKSDWLGFKELGGMEMVGAEGAFVD